MLPDGDIFTEDYRPRIEPLPDPGTSLEMILRSLSFLNRSSILFKILSHLFIVESDVDISRHYDDFDSKIFAMPTSRRQIRCSSLAGLKYDEWLQKRCYKCNNVIIFTLGVLSMSGAATVYQTQ